MRSEAELWEARARAADNAAEQLTRLGDELSAVLGRYYFGVDCVEGQDLHVALRSHFRAVGQELAGSARDARKLADDCRRAAQSLAGADALNAEGFASAGPG